MTSGDSDANTRSRLVTATSELFRRFGYNGTSLKKVTEAADAPIGSLYHHFPGGKTQLAKVVLETSGAAYRELFEVIWDDATDPGDAVAAFFDGAALVLEQTDFIDPCPIGGVAREVASTDETLRQAADGVFSSWIDTATTRFGDHGLTPSAAHDLAATIVAAIEGGFVLSRTARNGDLLRTIGSQMARLTEQTLAGAVSS